MPGTTYPSCIGGRRACPPEDCGGAWGYEEFLAAISDPVHDRHEGMLEWVGGRYVAASVATVVHLPGLLV